MSRRRSPALRLGLGVAFALVLLATTEVGLRMSGVRPAYRVEDLGQWRFAPNQNARESRGPKDGHTFRVTTNGEGLRTTLPRARTPGVPRVALMGDSTVFGWGVDDGGSLADGAAEALGGRVEVMNAGQPGYSTTMAAWLYASVVKAWQPDVTILFIPMHDTNLVLVSDREVLRGGEGVAAQARVWLARESRIYEMLRRALYVDAAKPWLLPGEASQEARVPRVSDAERTLNLDDMVRTASAWGGKVWVGHVPFQADIERGPGGGRPTQAWSSAWSAAHDAPLMDLAACCTGQAGLVLEDDPGHLTRAGNFAAGAALAARLRPLLGLDSAP